MATGVGNESRKIMLSVHEPKMVADLSLHPSRCQEMKKTHRRWYSRRISLLSNGELGQETVCPKLIYMNSRGHDSS